MRDHLFFALLFLLFGLPAGYAQTTPLPDPETPANTLVWMHPTDSPSVAEVNRHLEIGFRLGMEHRRMINNFLDGRDVPEVINPFDPEHLDAVATFELFDATTGLVIERHERIAFWYREYERDFSAEDPNEWTHRERETRFNMRVRFTPERAGSWRVYVTIKDRWGETTTTNQTRFNVFANFNPGFLRVGESGRFFCERQAIVLSGGSELTLPIMPPRSRPGLRSNQLCR